MMGGSSLLLFSILCSWLVAQVAGVAKPWNAINIRQQGAVPSSTPEMILSSLDGAIVLYGGWQKSDSGAIATSNDLYVWDPIKKTGSKLATGPSSSSALGITQIGALRAPNSGYVKMAGTGSFILMANLAFSACLECTLFGTCSNDCDLTASPEKWPALSLHIINAAASQPSWTDIGATGSVAGPVPESNFGFAIAGGQGKFFFFGGRGKDQSYNDHLSIFDIAQMTWSTAMPSTPSPQVPLLRDPDQAGQRNYFSAFSHSMEVLNNKIYFTNSSAIWEYDMAASSWAESSLQSNHRNRLATIVACGSKIWLVSVHNVWSNAWQTIHAVESLQEDSSTNQKYEFMLTEPQGMSASPHVGCINSRIYFDATIVSHEGGFEGRDLEDMVSWRKYFNTFTLAFEEDAMIYHPKTAPFDRSWEASYGLADETHFYRISKTDETPEICKSRYNVDEAQQCIKVELPKGELIDRVEFAVAQGIVAVCANQTYFRRADGAWNENTTHDWESFGGIKADCHKIVSTGDAFYIFDFNQTYRASPFDLAWEHIGSFHNGPKINFASSGTQNNPTRYTGMPNWVLLYSFPDGMYLFDAQQNTLSLLSAPEDIISPADGGGDGGGGGDQSKRIFLKTAGYQGKFFFLTGIEAGQYYTAGGESMASYDPATGVWSDITISIGGLPTDLPAPGQGQPPAGVFDLYHIDRNLILATWDDGNPGRNWDFRIVPVSAETQSSSNILFDLLFTYDGDTVCLDEDAVLDADVTLGAGSFPASVTLKGCRSDGLQPNILRSGATSTLICAEQSTCTEIQLVGVAVQCSDVDASPFVQILGQTKLRVESSSFLNCRSLGGGLLASFGGETHVSDSRFENLQGTLGSAISSQGGKLTSSNNHYINCVSGHGGAIYARPLGEIQISNAVATLVESDADITITGDQYARCVSTEGGALWIRRPRSLTISASSFENCEATTTGGGAVYLDDGTQAHLSSNTFKNCTASTGGGALIWVESAPTVAGSIEHLCDHPSEGNTAPWGACYASNAKRLIYSYDTRPYRTGIPVADDTLPISEQRQPFMVKMVDEYGHVINTENEGKVEVFSSQNFQLRVDDPNIDLAGTTIQTFMNGEANFTGVTVSTVFRSIDYKGGKTERASEPKLYFQGTDPITDQNIYSSVFLLPMANDSEVCGLGYVLELQASFGRCQQCAYGTYSRNPLLNPTYDFTSAQCFTCPAGAGAYGGCFDGYKVNTSSDEMWLEEEGAVRLRRCPRGKVLVRGAPGVIHLDECIECSGDSYSVYEAFYSSESDSFLAVEAQSSSEGFARAQDQCIECPTEATCSGGRQVDPKSDFWRRYDEWESRSWLRRQDGQSLEVTIYKCPPNSCLEGDSCADYHEGPVCGRCNSSAVMTASGCEPCSLENIVVGKALASAFGIIAFLLVYYWFCWKRLLDDVSVFAAFNNIILSALSCYTSVQEARSNSASKYGAVVSCFSWIGRAYKSVQKDLQGFLKIIISFYQVVSSFSTTFQVEWPEKISSVYRTTKVFQLDILTLPGSACLTHDWTYLDKLLAYTVSPLVVVPLIGIPSVVALIVGRQSHGGLHNHPKFDDVVGQFWYSLLFFLYLIYPAVSVATLQSFSCQYLGVEGDWLIADFWEECPWNNTGGAIFVWGMISTFLYPIGIPVLFLGVLYYFRIPQMAKQKISIANLQALIDIYRRENVTAEGDSILLHIAKISASTQKGSNTSQAGICSNSALNEFFSRIDEDGSGAITLQELSAYMEKEHLCEGLSGNSRLSAIVQASIEKGTEGMDLAAFKSFCRDLQEKHSLFTGTDIPLSLGVGKHPCSKLSRKQLETLVFYEWSFHEGDGGFATDMESIITQEIEEKGSAAEEEHLADQEDEQPRLSRKALSKKLMTIIEELSQLGHIVLPSMAWNGVLEGEQDALNKIGFLFTMYEVKHWYFEMVEMVRKLLVTSILVFVYRGEPAQLAAGLVISFGGLIIYYSARPFVSDRLDTLQIFSLITQCMNLFYGIMLIVSECPSNQGPRKSPFIEIIVVLMNSLIVGVPVIQGVIDNMGVLWEMVPEEVAICSSNEFDEDEENHAEESMHEEPEHSQSGDGDSESMVAASMTTAGTAAVMASGVAVQEKSGANTRNMLPGIQEGKRMAGKNSNSVPASLRDRDGARRSKDKGSEASSSDSAEEDLQIFVESDKDVLGAQPGAAVGSYTIPAKEEPKGGRAAPTMSERSTSAMEDHAKTAANKNEANKVSEAEVTVEVQSSIDSDEEPGSRGRSK